MSNSAIDAVTSAQVGEELALAQRAEELPAKQREAMEALKLGKSFPQAAEAAGVNRATVYRWLQADPHFKAAYNAWQRELSESAHSRLLKLTEKAVDVVEKALECDDRKVAMKLLMELGSLRPARRGTIDPNVLRMQMLHQKSRREYRADMKMMDHLLAKMGLSLAQRRRYIRDHGVKPGSTALALPDDNGNGTDAATDATGNATDDATDARLSHDSAAAPDAQERAD